MCAEPLVDGASGWFDALEDYDFGPSTAAMKYIQVNGKTRALQGASGGCRNTWFDARASLVSSFLLMHYTYIHITTIRSIWTDSAQHLQ